MSQGVRVRVSPGAPKTKPTMWDERPVLDTRTQKRGGCKWKPYKELQRDRVTVIQESHKLQMVVRFRLPHPVNSRRRYVAVY